MIEGLPRRERDVFETLCRLGQGTTAAVRDALATPLSDSAVRTLLSRLEAKRLVAKTGGAGGNVYAPAPRVDAVAGGALRRIVDTFFAGSAVSAATALLDLTQTLSAEEIEALRRAIDRVEEDGQ